MKKNFLTLEDLYDYYSSTANNASFDANEANGDVVVQMPATTEFEKTNADTDGLVPIVLKACHTGLNDNRFEISSETMESALSTFLNRPILGFIHEVDGVPQFYRHNHHMDEDGEIVYDEYPVGIVPESGNPHLEHDDEANVDRVVVNGILFETYSKAVEILKREGQCDVSVELAIKKMKFDAKRKALVVDEFSFNGVTILGVDEDGNAIKPGMAGSNIQLADFNAENNSMFDSSSNELINSAIADFNKKHSEKGGEIMPDEKIVLREFALSHDDIRCALYRLIGDDENSCKSILDVYDDYFIYRDWATEVAYRQNYTKNDDEVALDGEPVEVHAEWLTAGEADALANLRENYQSMVEKVENYDALIEKVANYDAMAEKLANYEAEPSRMELFNKYNEALADSEEFNALKNVDAHFTLSLEEIESKIDAIVLERAKTQMFDRKPLENGEPSRVVAHPIPTESNKISSRYGDLFRRN